MQKPDGGQSRPVADRRGEMRYEGTLAGTFTYTPPEGGVRVVPCTITSLSAAAMVVHADMHGQEGEHIWVEIDGFGPLRAEIGNVHDGEFICFTLLRADAQKRLAAWVSLLRRRGGRLEGDHRQFMRTAPRDARTTIGFADGTTVDAQLVNVSRSGASLHTEHIAAPGEAVSIGQVPAHVVRCFEGGFAVAFDMVLDAADADRLVAGYRVAVPPLRRVI